jgi:thiazole synthase ThiGH ThiG subunit
MVNLRKAVNSSRAAVAAVALQREQAFRKQQAQLRRQLEQRANSSRAAAAAALQREQTFRKQQEQLRRQLGQRGH